jgi:diguanylate cyclase (GGDEF)-like protein
MQSDEPIVQADMMLRRAGKRDLASAAVFVAALGALTVVASRIGNVPGPIVDPFIPITATFWGAADLLTAFLLFMQFSVNGIRAFVYLGGAYAFAGLLTIPYVVYFPGLFHDSTLGPEAAEISLYLWLVWHLVFPVVIAGYRIYDPEFRRRFLEGPRVRSGLRFAVLCVAAGAALAIGVIVPYSDRLPDLAVGGHFTPAWTGGFAPLVFVINAAAAITVIGFARKPSLLQVWITVALATSALDGLLNAFVLDRYSLSWYLGKIETLITATVVMVVLLLEVGGLYRRLGTMAIVDPLTGLRNRRSFDEYLQWTLGQRAKADVAFLLLDVDRFKQYNDRYGHAAGDVCLQRIARALQDSLLRPVDLAARYGGEEFVVLLPDTTARGAQDVAERIRLTVEGLGIAHADSPVAPVVTLSIGVAHASAAGGVDAGRLFALADSALYEAKVRRNTTVVADSIVAA